MPIDTHSYLTSRGWKGKGTALREGGLERPIVQAQKNNLKGLGKDRDDGFQFWDHIYSVASSTIQIQVATSDDEGDSEEQRRSNPDPSIIKREEGSLQLTSTGILSNRRPTISRRASSDNLGSISQGRTPDSNNSSLDRRDLFTMAKREAAKVELYRRFARGGIFYEGEKADEKMKITLSQPEERPESDEKARRREERRKRREERRQKKERKLAKKERKRLKAQALA